MGMADSERSETESTTTDAQMAQANMGCLERLRELHGKPGEKVYTLPTDPGTGGSKTEVQTNVFGIEVSKATLVYQYVVHAKADLTPTKEVVFTKKGKEDFIVRDRHTKCCDLLFYAVSINPDVFKMPQGNHLVYDGQSCLFTTVDLFPNKSDVLDKKVLIELDGSEINNEDLKSLKVILLEIHAAKKESFQISGENIARRTADANLKANNRAYTQFLELVLNQTCIKETVRFACFEHGKVYCVQPWNEGYEKEECPDVGDGKSLFPGIKKTIQFIEGPQGRGQNNPSVVIDAMKAAFHKQQTVLYKTFEIIQRDPSMGLRDAERDKVVPVIKGLHCNTTYTGKTRHHRIEGVHLQNAKTAKIEMKEGNSVTVEIYFREKYNKTLEYPNANLIICKDRGNLNLYPAELLNVDKDQRVTIPQQTSNQSQKTTRECAVLPRDRQNLIMKGKNAADISETNELLQHFGVKVYSGPMKTNARTMEGKKIQFQKAAASSASGKWRPPQGSYVKPAAFPSIWAMYAFGTSSSRYTEKDLQDLCSQFISACQKKGINVCRPGECDLVPVDKAEEKLRFAAENNCKYLFVVTDDNITHLHQKCKLFERDSGMIIQDMKMSKATSVTKQGKWQTLENVINKTNVKLGGLNHEVVDAKKSLVDDQLVIGVGLSAPTVKFMGEKGFLNPLVVGYASNAKSTHEFVGDFLFGPSGQDTLPSIEEILKNSLESFKKHRHALPKRIVIYRSGASEGSHASILSYEIPLARLILEQFNDQIKLIYIVVTKDHSYRFFKPTINTSDKPTEQNIPAGIVLDTGVTHPSCKQFFMNSHTTLQGTAKTPLYTVLADDCKAPMDRLQELTYTLCHHHQIVALTTSVPTPLYVANEYAKRGRNLWVEKTGGAPQAIPQGVSEKDLLEKFTKEVSYVNSVDLSDKRVNA